MRSRRSNTQKIGVLAYPRAQLAAVYGLVDLFEAANRLASEDASCAARLEVEKLVVAKPLVRPDTPLTALVVPPSLHPGDPQAHPKRLVDWTAARYAEGTLLCSVCAGTFLLAQTGLLDGRAATTHWALEPLFRSRFPAVDLDIDKLLIDDGDIVTAGGLMAWTDLGLRVVDRLLGRKIMLTTARFFLVDPGGREQRFYSGFSPELGHGDAPILKTQRWLQTKSAKKISVPMMAAQAKLGERTFLRRFHKATGFRPTQYVQRLRVGTARGLLEASRYTVDEIAWKVGYEDSSAFGKTFRSIMGLSPGEYRRRFCVARIDDKE